MGQFVDRGGGQRESPAGLDLLLDFTILPMPSEMCGSDFDDQIERTESLPRHQLMIALGVANLAAEDALLLHIADPRFAQHPSHRVSSPTAGTTQLSVAGVTEGLLAGHFQPIVSGQSARRRQRGPTSCSAVGGRTFKNSIDLFFPKVGNGPAPPESPPLSGGLGLACQPSCPSARRLPGMADHLHQQGNHLVGIGQGLGPPLRGGLGFPLLELLLGVARAPRGNTP